MWTNLQKTADLVTFTEEVLNGKLQFLCSVYPGKFIPRKRENQPRKFTFSQKPMSLKYVVVIINFKVVTDSPTTQLEKCCRFIIALTVCPYRVTYLLKSESTLYSCLNVKKPLAQNGGKIWPQRESNPQPLSL